MLKLKSITCCSCIQDTYCNACSIHISLLPVKIHNIHRKPDKTLKWCLYLQLLLCLYLYLYLWWNKYYLAIKKMERKFLMAELVGHHCFIFLVSRSLTSKLRRQSLVRLISCWRENPYPWTGQILKLWCWPSSRKPSFKKRNLRK